MTSGQSLSAAESVRDLERLRRRLFGGTDGRTLKPLGLGGVVVGAGALDTLPALVGELSAGHDHVAVLGDNRPMAGASPELKAAIEQRLVSSGHLVRRVTIGDENARVHLDGHTLDAATAACSGAGSIVSVGSGSVVDAGKAVSARLQGLPHVVVQTAASVNGFADDQSVLLVDGVKRTTPTRWPDRLIIDTDVLTVAPAAMNRAGLGDLLATYTAPADWYLASIVGQDASYSPTVVALAREHIDALLDVAAGVGRGDADAIEALGATLALSGISMGVAGRTSPGSGMEHTVSHLIEMKGEDGDPPLHGAKVGVLSVLAAILWQHVREAARGGGLRSLRFPSLAEMETRVDAAFAPLDPSGGMGTECWRDYAGKLQRWHDAAEDVRSLPDRWDALDSALDGLLVPPDRLVDALRASGAPLRLSDLGIDAETARWALTHCHLMRDRFTVADLAFLMGRWEQADVDRVLAEAATLGTGL